jgi:hypothetical protein
VRELARESHQRGVVVVYGRCDEDLAIPYRPFVECLSHLVAHVSDSVLADVNPGRLAELTRLIPSLVDRRPGLPASVVADSDAERYLLFGAVGWLLTALALQSLVMVILDDLQWADRPTLQLLAHQAGLPLGRVLLVGVHRDSERPSGPLVEMLGALPGQATVTRIALRGLTLSQAVALMAATAGRDPDEAGGTLAGVLHREADGNPFIWWSCSSTCSRPASSPISRTGVAPPLSRAPRSICRSASVTCSGPDWPGSGPRPRWSCPTPL